MLLPVFEPWCSLHAFPFHQVWTAGKAIDELQWIHEMVRVQMPFVEVIFHSVYDSVRTLSLQFIAPAEGTVESCHLSVVVKYAGRDMLQGRTIFKCAVEVVYILVVAEQAFRNGCERWTMAEQTG